MMRITETVKQLLIINIIFFIGSYLVGPVAQDFLALHLPTDDRFKFWQPLTHMFMHGNVMHIFFNMFALYSFGVVLEQIWGGKKFLFFYISCGLGAALLHLGVNYYQLNVALEGAANMRLSKDTLHQVLNVSFTDGMYYQGSLFQDAIKPILEEAGKLNKLNQENFTSLFNAAVINQTPSVGASGAIYGVLVAFAFMLPNAELMLMFVPIPIKAKYFVPGLLAVDLFLGLKGGSIFGGGDGIAHFAHIGGALVGFLMMWFWKKDQFNKNRWN